jgi:hypothetical protein
MGLKDLFIVSEETPNDKPVEQTTPSPAATSVTKFPSSTPQPEETSVFSSFGFPKSEPAVVTPTFTSTPSTQGVSEEQLAKALATYTNGFDSLNQPGYDFYEFYQAVIGAGVDNPQIYTMAFAMGSGMDKTINKSKLISQSDFYLNEINKVYNDFVVKGNSKRQEIVDQKNHENQSLMGELDLMKQQLEQLQIQIADRQNKLSVIDSKYGPMISEVDNKLTANNMAKDKIVNSIELVKQGINNNLK